MSDNYGQYIDFKYRAVFNIWSSVEDEDKYRFSGTMYKFFSKELKKIREKYCQVQRTLYTLPISSGFCRDECTCENLRDLKFAVEREIFLKVRNKLPKMNSKIRDFNLLCGEFVFNVLKHKMSMIDRKLNQLF